MKYGNKGGNKTAMRGRFCIKNSSINYILWVIAHCKCCVCYPLIRLSHKRGFNGYKEIGLEKKDLLYGIGLLVPTRMISEGEGRRRGLGFVNIKFSVYVRVKNERFFCPQYCLLFQQIFKVPCIAVLLSPPLKINNH